MTLAFAVLAPIPVALAQRDAPPAEPPPPGQAPTGAATTAPPVAAPAAAPPPGVSEGDGDEGDHPPAAAAAAVKPPPFQRQPTVLKDGMLRIPGGRFTMGTSEKTAPPNERPARAVAVPPFWIDRNEVTVAAYRACVDRGACARPPRTSPSCTFDQAEPLLPVSCVPWASANAYCLAVNKRLPREVEWENAARGTLAIRFPWGGGPTKGHACGAAAILAGETTNRSCAGKRPSKVGAHLGGASPYGVLDMSGNVEEWVADWYADTVSELSPRAGASHVLRGGGWLTVPSLARTTSRNWGSVREAGPNVGFRCARDD